MAKQHHKQQPPAQAKKPVATETSSFSYLLRNFAVLAVIGIFLLSVDRINKKQSELPKLYQEFQQLRQSGADRYRLEQLYNQIMEIQNDTSFLTRVTRGYHWAVHDLAIGGKQNVEEAKSKAAKELTREEKLAMRIGIWPFIDYIVKNTPDTAVIYLPEGDSATSNNSQYNYIYDPEWMEYFLYPRLCLAMGREQDHPDLAKRITHVVIFQGKGYDKLHYVVPVEMRPKDDVLPINLPPVKTQPTP